MSNGLMGWNEEWYDLSPANHRASADLVRFVSDQVEAHRAAIRASTEPEVKKGERQLDLLGLPAKHDIYAIDRQRWYELLTDLGLIEKCADAFKVPMEEFLTLVIEQFRVPNWQVFFWIREYLKLSRRLTYTDAAALQEAQRKAIQAHLAQQSRAGAQGRDEKLYAGPREWVQQHWAAKGIEEYGGNRSAFARDYVVLVEEKFGKKSKVTVTTIAREWLKGL